MAKAPISPISSVLLAAALLTPVSASAAAFVFHGSGSGTAQTIPDATQNGPAAWGTPLDVTFNVTGLTAPILSLSLSITMAHQFIGDLDVRLKAPGSSGLSPFVIFSQVGQGANQNQSGYDYYGSGATLGTWNYNGIGTPLDGTGVAAQYVFSDSATSSLWTAAGFNLTTGAADWTQTIPVGSYRTSVGGIWDNTGTVSGGNPKAGQPTSLNLAFGGLTSGQANGTWTLEFRDGSESGTGFVTDATLTITPVPEPSQYAVLFGVGLLAFAAIRRRCAA
jgi:subtilisin-like proprotein convertase family protein